MCHVPLIVKINERIRKANEKYLSKIFKYLNNIRY